MASTTAQFIKGSLFTVDDKDQQECICMSMVLEALT
jgi:hypothetical protein